MRTVNATAGVRHEFSPDGPICEIKHENHLEMARE
jgi:hypothetical protein